MNHTRIVYTKTGPVRGVRENGLAIYKGIPYAKSPVGELRFRAAQPIDPWNDVLEADAFGPACPQQNYINVPRNQRGSKPGQCEDGCLNLNIWAPADAKKAPVLFYIHGGSFIYGSGSENLYCGETLATEGDIIVVTFNYRVGVLGFMDFDETGRFDANCGFTDMMEALRWVHANIEEFGGDSENITVCGQSAGAISVSAFPVHPQMGPLISKVIMRSGSPCYIRAEEEHRELSSQFLDIYGHGSTDWVLNLSAEELVQRGLSFQSYTKLGESTFSVYVDGSVIPEAPVAAASRGAAAGIPLFIGTLREEMSFACSPVLSKMLDVTGAIEQNLRREDPRILASIRKEYARYGKRAESVFLADRAFRMGSIWYAQVYSEFADCWMYRHDFEPKALKAIGLRATHSSDMPLFFGNIQNNPLGFAYSLDCVSKAYVPVMKQMHRDLFRFMRTGTLGWTCVTKDYPAARIYDRIIREAPAVTDNVRRAFQESRFFEETFEGVS